MTTLRDLTERLEKATSADQELDAALYRALGGEVPTEFMGTGVKLSWDASGKAWCYLPGGMRVSFTPPALTGSIDAALALCERVLPGWSVRLFIHPDAAYADIYRLGELTHFPEGGIERRITSPNFEGIKAEHRAPALAVLIALLRARTALQDAKGGTL